MGLTYATAPMFIFAAAVGITVAGTAPVVAKGAGWTITAATRTQSATCPRNTAPWFACKAPHEGMKTGSDTSPSSRYYKYEEDKSEDGDDDEADVKWRKWSSWISSYLFTYS